MACGATGLCVLAAAAAIEAGGGPDEAIARAKEVRETLKMWFAVDTLEYLRKGGRIGGATRLDRRRAEDQADPHDRPRDRADRTGPHPLALARAPARLRPPAARIGRRRLGRPAHPGPRDGRAAGRRLPRDLRRPARLHLRDRAGDRRPRRAGTDRHRRDLLVAARSGLSPTAPRGEAAADLRQPARRLDQLGDAADRGGAGAGGVEAEIYDGMGRLPHFNPDDDPADGVGLDAEVAALRAALGEADALLLSTPEYAGALPGSFKNLLDWTVGGGQMDGCRRLDQRLRRGGAERRRRRPRKPPQGARLHRRPDRRGRGPAPAAVPRRRRRGRPDRAAEARDAIVGAVAPVSTAAA